MLHVSTDHKAFENCCARGFHQGFLERTFGTRAYLLHQVDWPSCEHLPAKEAERVLHFCRRLTWMNELDCTLGQYAASVHGRCDHLLGPEAYACCASCLTGLAISRDPRLDPNRPVCISPQPELRLPATQQCCLMHPNAPQKLCTHGIAVCSPSSPFQSPLSSWLPLANPPRFVPPMLPPVPMRLNDLPFIVPATAEKGPAIFKSNSVVAHRFSNQSFQSNSKLMVPMNAPQLIVPSVKHFVDSIRSTVKPPKSAIEVPNPILNVKAPSKPLDQRPKDIVRSKKRPRLNATAGVHDHKEFVDYNAFELSRFQRPSLRKSIYNGSQLHRSQHESSALPYRSVPNTRLRDMYCSLSCDHSSSWCFVKSYDVQQSFCEMPLRCPLGQVPNQFNRRCIPLNECKQSVHNCNPHFEYCVNTYEGFMCECKPGYRRSLDQPDICVNIDECVEKDKACPMNSRCVDRNPGYECICFNGFKSVDSECVLSIPIQQNRYKLRPIGPKRLVDEPEDVTPPYSTTMSIPMPEMVRIPVDDSNETNRSLPTGQKQTNDWTINSNMWNKTNELQSSIDFENANIPMSPYYSGNTSLLVKVPEFAPSVPSGNVNANGSDVERPAWKQTNSGLEKNSTILLEVNRVQGLSVNETMARKAKNASEEKCPQGYEFVAGQCVDVDECKAQPDRCNKDNLICVNLVGSFECRASQLSAADRFVAGRQAFTSSTFWEESGRKIVYLVIAVNVIFVFLAINVTTFVYKRMNSRVGFDLQPKQRLNPIYY